LQSLKNDIINTLVYFDIFNYPLKREEIFFFIGQRCSENNIDSALQLLATEGKVFRLGDFYSLQNDSGVAERRLQGNYRAIQQLSIASRISRVLFHFPYVRGVGISGSLSKNFADEKSDIDFFIITAPNRLWIARSMMHLFKKFTYLFGKQNWFCMNYYVDRIGLEIIEKNIYTATEMATILPFEGMFVFHDLYAANDWVQGFLPNYFHKIPQEKGKRKMFLKAFIEKIFNTKFGDKLDDWLMNVTASRWQKKTRSQRLNKRGIVMGMDASKHCAKPDPRNFQQKVMDIYHKRTGEMRIESLESIGNWQ
jgi:predicted nucleotidyltransferase